MFLKSDEYSTARAHFSVHLVFEKKFFVVFLFLVFPSAVTVEGEIVTKFGFGSREVF